MASACLQAATVPKDDVGFIELRAQVRGLRMVWRFMAGFRV